MPLPTPEDTPVGSTFTDQFEGKEIVKDTTVNRNAFIESDYNDSASMIAAYVEGSVLKCTYYTLLANEGLQRGVPTNIFSIAHDETSNLHLMKISEFEMKLSQSLQVTYNSDRSESSITGSGVTYPNFYPKLGDIFLYEMTSGTVGIFQVTEIEPLSYFNQRLHRIGFFFERRASDDNINGLDSRVVKHVVFSKENLLEGSTALLTSDSYTQLSELKNYRHIIIQSYLNRYYSDFYKSVVNENGVYDPYIVRFLQAYISYKDYSLIPTQLYPKVDIDFNKTVLSRLLDNHETRVDNLLSHFTHSVELSGLHDVNITALINRNYVDLVKDGVNNYIFTQDFYEENIDDMNDFELLVYNVIKTKSIPDINVFIETHMKTIGMDITVDDFYRYPILIRLIDIAIRSVTTGKKSNE